jgi:hypothetical protein
VANILADGVLNHIKNRAMIFKQKIKNTFTPKKGKNR